MDHLLHSYIHAHQVKVLELLTKAEIIGMLFRYAPKASVLVHV